MRRDWRAGGTLYMELRRRYKRRKRHYGLERRGRLQGKRMIEDRPAEIEAGDAVGHWEIDTVMGASWEKPCIVTLVERATGYLMIGKLPNRTTKALNRRVVEMIKAAPLSCATITSHNGTEFHGYAEIEAATGTTIYFARPHHPWQRGTNENTNGLIRQYLPKGKSMANLTQKQCDAMRSHTNSIPGRGSAMSIRRQNSALALDQDCRTWWLNSPDTPIIYVRDVQNRLQFSHWNPVCLPSLPV